MFEFAAAFGIKTKAARNLKNLCAPRCQMLYVQINHVIHLINCIKTPDWFVKYAESLTLNYYEFKDPFGLKNLSLLFCIWQEPFRLKRVSCCQAFLAASTFGSSVEYWNCTLKQFGFSFLFCKKSNCFLFNLERR